MKNKLTLIFLISGLIKIYQKTRLIRPSACRFYPSCSDYMLQALDKHGLFNGICLGLTRLCKCHPFHDGGIDDVPQPK
jgi:putative membrane protein insertion efficiency factor